jgi:hypothetical protein
MADVGPFAITARNAAQAAYIARSRAEPRGIGVQTLRVDEAPGGAWLVTLTVADEDADRLTDAHVDEDTQVLHFRRHRR